MGRGGRQKRFARVNQANGISIARITHSGWPKGNWTPDHQPPTKLNPNNAPQRLYPHCKSCSLSQGGQVKVAKYGKSSVGRAAAGTLLAGAAATAGGLKAIADDGSFQKALQQAKDGASKLQMDNTMFDASCESAVNAGTAGALSGLYGTWWWMK